MPESNKKTPVMPIAGVKLGWIGRGFSGLTSNYGQSFERKRPRSDNSPAGLVDWGAADTVAGTWNEVMALVETTEVGETCRDSIVDVDISWSSDAVADGRTDVVTPGVFDRLEDPSSCRGIKD